MKPSFYFILVVLFVFISCDQKQQPTDNATNTNTSQTNGLNTRIVFVNQDTLLERYDLYKENKVELEEQSLKAQNSISSKLEGFQKKVEKFQQKVYEIQQKASTIAPVELQRLEQQFAKEQEALAKEEQRLVQQRDNSAMELEKKIIDLQANLKNKIDTYLEEVAAEKSYDFVLIKGTGGGVLYGNDKLDITDDVVAILNERYALDKK
jgi:outer membrane protein